MNQKLPAPRLVPLGFRRIAAEEQKQNAKRFYQMFNRRRTVRDFSDEPVPFEIIKTAIKTARTAPSGANMQPQRFVVVKNAKIKSKIRAAAEEERKSY